MAISDVINRIDRHGRELLVHGTVSFPVGCYYDDLQREETPWHWHAELEAVVAAAGDVWLDVGKASILVHQGEGFFINTGVLHAVRPASNGACRLHAMVFHPRLIGGSGDSVFWNTYLQPVMEHPQMRFLNLKHQSTETDQTQRNRNWQQESICLIEDAWKRCCTEQEGYEFAVREDLSRLILLLKMNLPAAVTRKSGKIVRDEARIKEMLQFIHSFYAEDITVEAIAASVGISESECLRCFRSTIEISPIQYLRQYRIQEASRMLHSTDFKIVDIALMCGFRNVSYFTKTFREMKGCTPREWRQGEKPYFV